MNNRILRVERLTGIPRQRVRYYREKGIIPSRKEKAGSRQFYVYQDEDIEKLKWIDRLLTMGLKLNNAAFVYEHHRDKLSGDFLELLKIISVN